MSPETSTAQWFTVTVPAAECGTKARILQNDFEALYTVNRAPKDAALFTITSPEHSSFFFSPGAVTIARGLIQQFGGVPSAPPSEHEHSLVLLVGLPATISVLSKMAARPRPRPQRTLNRLLGRG
jgi:hypothetical protein